LVIRIITSKRQTQSGTDNGGIKGSVSLELTELKVSITNHQTI